MFNKDKYVIIIISNTLDGPELEYKPLPSAPTPNVQLRSSPDEEVVPKPPEHFLATVTLKFAHTESISTGAYKR